MHNASRVAFALLALSLLTAPQTVMAKTAAAPDASATVPVAAPTPPTPPVPPTPPKGDTPTASSMTFGELTVEDPSLVFKSDHIDVYLSIKNASKGDERLGGADTTWKTSGVVEVTKDSTGKETEGPIGEVLAAGITTEFSKSGKWLRIKDVQTEPKASDVVKLTLYFRRSPNAVLKIAANGKAAPSADGSKSGIMDWLKK